MSSFTYLLMDQPAPLTDAPFGYSVILVLLILVSVVLTRTVIQWRSDSGNYRNSEPQEHKVQNDILNDSTAPEISFGEQFTLFKEGSLHAARLAASRLLPIVLIIILAGVAGAIFPGTRAITLDTDVCIHSPATRPGHACRVPVDSTSEFLS